MASDSRALTLKLLADTADFQKKLQEGSKDVDSIGENPRCPTLRVLSVPSM